MSYLRVYGGYDQPIPLTPVPGTGASETITLISVTIPEIDEGRYFLTGKVTFGGPAGATAACSASGGLDDAIASAYGDNQSIVLAASSSRQSVKLESVLFMRDDWAPIVLLCHASGLQNDESVLIRSYVFALLRIG